MNDFVVVRVFVDSVSDLNCHNFFFQIGVKEFKAKIANSIVSYLHPMKQKRNSLCRSLRTLCH